MRVAHSAAPVAWEYLARNSSPPGVTAGPVPGMRMPESTVSAWCIEEPGTGCVEACEEGCCRPYLLWGEMGVMV
jgi:hypothetical protein